MNRISTILQSIINVIGNVTMGTTATTVTGAIAEHETQITALQSKPNVKWYFFSSGSQNWASGSSSYSITVPAAESGYYRWVIGDRCTNRNVTYVWSINGTTLTFYAYNSSSSAASGVINGIVAFLDQNQQITV